MAERNLSDIIQGCCKGRETDRKALYERFYGYAMSVCMAYANDREDAGEMLNDGFLKVFKNIKELKNQEVIVPWIRKIMVNTAIDYYRKNARRARQIQVETVAWQLEEPYLNDEALFAQFSAEDILQILQQMSAPYRMVFSLYVMEGFSHREIAQQLNIAESTSRSHLTEANRLLRQSLSKQTQDNYARTKR
ncbi:sigma-70 family RNA polymerase sigma factor [Rhodocytophaga rosea]|uniref:Sigma-70 family RNA polymerase sigma factor n=1 Tax=Rhodocytophaga rosea TaxID=2704465 RepID=A0A6C0GD12_9BACT|nr:sigma-70 family RNA polymerase sigma factor [Rhodocytophaga rosea]QHT65866.1 sigma-70 family RNA polymerase sigma factor [Rhodocytophaga rosea]